MALRRNLPAYRKLDQLVMDGKAQLVATPTDSYNLGAPVLITPPKGQCAIITKIFCMGYAERSTSPGLADTGRTQRLAIIEPFASNTVGSATFLSFMRVNALHSAAASPDWQSAVPCKPVEWEPEDPIIVPPGFTLASSNPGALDSNDMAGQCFMCRGYVVDVGTARALGFHVNEYNSIATSSPDVLSMRSGVTSGTFTSSAASLIDGRTGQCIQIVDMFIRAQPLTHAPTKSFTVRQTDDTVIFKGANNNPAEFAEWNFSPGIYLKSGQGVEIIGDSGIRASITITYRFVDAVDVPQDQWWAYREPQLPTPAGASTGVGQLGTTASSTLSLYYPGLDTSATSPGNGKQHIVEGYAVSLQKDSTAASDRFYYAITTGTTGGSIGVGSASTITTTNYLISPIMAGASHDQALFASEDSLCVPCPKDTGLIFVDTTGLGPTLAASPAASDLNVDEFHVLVWGRTTQSKFTSSTHFQGAS